MYQKYKPTTPFFFSRYISRIVGFSSTVYFTKIIKWKTNISMKSAISFTQIFKRLTLNLLVILAASTSVQAGVVTVWGDEKFPGEKNLISAFYSSLSGHSATLPAEPFRRTNRKTPQSGMRILSALPWATGNC